MSDRPLLPQRTADGSYTFFSTEFQETFHSSFGAKQEAEVRYIEPCQIKQLASQQSKIRILDICYGLGYNSAAALDAIWQIAPECQVELYALELDANIPQQAVKQDLLKLWQPSVALVLGELATTFQVDRYPLSARLLMGDARQTIKSLVNLGWQADAIFLDPFSPPKCPQLWTVEFITLVSQCLSPVGILSTYSASAAARTALLDTGLKLGSIVGAGRKSPGTMASFKYKKLLSLSVMEREHLRTRAAIPYRDRTLQESAEQIILNRQKEQQASSLLPTSQWRKRWSK